MGEENMRNKDSFQVKYMGKDNETDAWIAFCAIHPRHSKSQQVRSGGPIVMQRLVGRLGYKGVIIISSIILVLGQDDAFSKVLYSCALWGNSTDVNHFVSQYFPFFCGWYFLKKLFDDIKFSH